MSTRAERRPTLSRREFLAALAGGAAVAASPTRAFGGETLPGVLADYLQTVVRDLNAVRADYPEGFFFITDLHNPSNNACSGEMIARLTPLTGLWKTFCGGDLPSAYRQSGRTAREEAEWAWSKYRAGWIDPILAAGGVVYTARGNHDLSVRDSSSQSAGATLSAAETRERFCLSHRRPYAVSNPADPTACYFYRDVPAAKIRYIVADSSDLVTGTTTGWSVSYGIRETQLAWIGDVALGTLPAGWDVIVIQHIPPAPIVSDASGEEPSLHDFRLLAEAFQNRGTFAVGAHRWDFSSATGRILLNLSGHEHADRWSHLNGIPYVTVACDAAYNDYRYWSPYCGNLPGKALSTIYAQTFDAVRVSSDHETILFQRIGGGQDRLLHTRVRKVSAGGTLVLGAPSLGASPTWVAYDGDRVKQDGKATDPTAFCTFYHDHVAVSAAGVVTGGTPGSSMVFAHDADYQKELYCVETI